jgi:hypothetical protein
MYMLYSYLQDIKGINMCFEYGFYISDLIWVMLNLIIMAQNKYDHLALVLHLIVDLLNAQVQLLN